jgi:DNA-binding CsgD family transcriptional regulator
VYTVVYTLNASRHDGKDQVTTRPRPDHLTARETEVLALIATGRTNAQIAADLFISRSTVKTHINNIFAKTGLADRAQAVRYAHQHQLTDSGPDDHRAGHARPPLAQERFPIRKPAGNGSSGSSR